MFGAFALTDITKNYYYYRTHGQHCSSNRQAACMERGSDSKFQHSASPIILRLFRELRVVAASRSEIECWSYSPTQSSSTDLAHDMPMFNCRLQRLNSPFPIPPTGIPSPVVSPPPPSKNSRRRCCVVCTHFASLPADSQSPDGTRRGKTSKENRHRHLDSEKTEAQFRLHRDILRRGNTRKHTHNMRVRTHFKNLFHVYLPYFKTVLFLRK